MLRWQRQHRQNIARLSLRESRSRLPVFGTNTDPARSQVRSGEAREQQECLEERKNGVTENYSRIS